MNLRLWFLDIWAESDWPKYSGRGERLLSGRTFSSLDSDYRHCCWFYRGIVSLIVQLLLVLSLVFSYSQLIRLWGPSKFVDIVLFVSTVRDEGKRLSKFCFWSGSQTSNRSLWKVFIETRLIDYYWPPPIWVNWGSVTSLLLDKHIDGIFRNLILGGVGKSGFWFLLLHANEWEKRDWQIRAELSRLWLRQVFYCCARLIDRFVFSFKKVYAEFWLSCSLTLSLIMDITYRHCRRFYWGEKNY